ncbi:hypothetical protein ACFSLT_02955 [Novosphingobium resinovorum]
MATRIETSSSVPSALLRELASFVARPRILAPIGLRSREAWPRLALLTVLHIGGLLLVILPLLGLYQKTMGQPLPDAFDKLPAGWLLPITIVIAPVLEEMIFRGWQTGRPARYGCWRASACSLGWPPWRNHCSRWSWQDHCWRSWSPLLEVGCGCASVRRLPFMRRLIRRCSGWRRCCLRRSI